MFLPLFILVKGICVLNLITLRTVHIATFTLVIRAETITRQTIVVIHTLIRNEAQVLSCPAPKLGSKICVIELLYIDAPFLLF